MNRFLVVGFVLGYVGIEQLRRAYKVGRFRAPMRYVRTRLEVSDQRGIAAYLNFLDSLPVKGGERHT